MVAIELSGHGDSGRRPSYSLDLWADEPMAVVDDAGNAGPAIIIGHSMGGFVTLALKPTGTPVRMLTSLRATVAALQPWIMARHISRSNLGATSPGEGIRRMDSPSGR